MAIWGGPTWTLKGIVVLYRKTAVAQPCRLAAAMPTTRHERAPRMDPGAYPSTHRRGAAAGAAVQPGGGGGHRFTRAVAAERGGARVATWRQRGRAGAVR